MQIKVYMFQRSSMLLYNQRDSKPCCCLFCHKSLLLLPLVILCVELKWCLESHERVVQSCLRNHV